VWPPWAARERIRAPLVAGAGIVVLYLPWLGHIRGKSLGVIGFLEPLNAHNVLSDLMRPLAGYPYAGVDSIPTFPGLAVLIAVALLGAGALARRARTPEGVPDHFGLLVALAAATPVGLLLYSLVGTDLWLARNLYASAPAAALVLGTAIVALEARAAAAAVAVVLITLAIGTVRALSPSFRRPAFRTAAEQIDRRARPGDLMIMFPSFVDQAVQVQLHATMRVVSSSPAVWRSVPPGHTAFAILDDQAAQRLGIGLTPHEPGLRLVWHRHFTGLTWFSLLAYRRG
jgi:hypothetical protein